MAEYVYARHDFAPEHDDEITFHAGERIEVVEKDEQFSDGWWLGRNLAGKVGLFPASYTQPAPPNFEPPPAVESMAPPPTLELADNTLSSPPNPNPAAFQPLHEDSELSPSIDVPPDLSTAKGNGEVMLATMTDVQQAIEQLAHKDDFDGSRSFTFSSTRGESTDHETDHETDAEADGEDWHKSARQKLAEKAKKAVEEQVARDADEGRVPIRSTLPPIDVEMSDDSGDEDGGPLDDTSSPNGRRRRHSHIPEVDEEDALAPHPQDHQRISYSPSIQPSSRYIVPSPGLNSESEFTQDSATESGLPTATRSSFPQNERARTPDNNGSLPSPVSPTLRGISNGISAATNGAENHPSSVQLAFPSKSQTLSLQEATGVLPSPATSFTGHRPGYSISSANSSARVTASSPLPGAQNADLSAKRPQHAHPADWTVDEVVDWLRSKGFDEAVCEKFTEQEITGDVLLELDVNVLKSEIGILAYGKRMRISNAISELRRPPSIVSSSAEQSTRPGSFSHGSPLAPQHGKTPSSAPMSSTGFASLVNHEGPYSGNLAGPSSMLPRRDSDPGIRSTVDKVTDSSATIGLGFGIPSSLIPGSGQGKPAKGRPAQLSLSPSNGALGANGKRITVEQEQGEEDRAVLSDSDTKNISIKGRSSFFGRQNSSSSTSKLPSPQKITTPRSDVTQNSEGGRSRPQPRKRSLDATREGSRLSFFGGTLAGTLGKARKPPPRYTTTPDIEASSDRGTLSLSRFYHPSGGSRKSSTRSSAFESSILNGKEDKREKRGSKDSDVTKDKKESILRKRRMSSTPDATPPPSADPSTLKAGQSILEQIGTPDHKGWMRKKGENYNSWKGRYFVLKGPHLYWLKSNSSSETKIKGYVNIVGYRIIADENVDPGRYGFKLVHESDRAHFFSSDEHAVIREWMKALMKATIDRDYSSPVVSSVNVPTIPLAVAQAMNPAPRPPSPNARAATQRAMRRENTNQLSTRDAEILMGMPPAPSTGGRPRVESFFNELDAVDPVSPSTSPRTQAPPVRPPRELRKKASTKSSTFETPVEPELIEWANNHLPSTLQIASRGSICGGLELLRIAESIKGLRTSIVPDDVFPRDPDDKRLDGLFTLFDFLLDNDVKMGAVSINDVRQGKRDKIVQLLNALRAWEDKRRAVLESIGKSSMQAGPFIAPVIWNE